MNDAVRISVKSNPVRGFEVWVFWRVCSSILVDLVPGFGRNLGLLILDLGLGLAHSWSNRLEVRDFWRGLKGFEVQYF